MDLAVKEPARNFVIGAWVIAAVLLWLVLRFDLLPALLAGLARLRAGARADDALEFRSRTTRQDRRGGVHRRRRRRPARPGGIRLPALLSQRYRRLRPAAEEVGRRHPELARPPSGLARPYPADRRRGPARQRRDVAQGAPRRRADGRPGRNEGSGPGADRHGHRRAHRLAPGGSARGLPAARARARQSRRPLHRSVSPRRLRPGPDRRPERGVDRVLSGDRAAAPRHPAAADQDDDRRDLRRRAAYRFSAT